MNIFDKIEEHKKEAENPTIKTKLKKLRRWLTPFLTGLLLKAYTKFTDAFLMYLFFKLLNII
jgi:hypothetical protein